MIRLEPRTILFFIALLAGAVISSLIVIDMWDDDDQPAKPPSDSALEPHTVSKVEEDDGASFIYRKVLSD